MKHYIFLVSFAFVNVSSNFNYIDYIRDVAITNAHIELAYKMNNCIIKEKVVLNGLEHVIKNIVESKRYSLVSMNNMFAVPEYVPTYNDLCASHVFHMNLRQVIESELNIPVPKFPEENIKSSVVVDLGMKRRESTRKALKNILNRITNYGEPGNVTNLINKRSLGTNALEKRINRALAGPEKEVSTSCMCHFIALFMSTKYPESHVKYIQIHSDDTCTLKDDYRYSLPTYETYRKINGQWCQVNGNKVQPLKELL